MKCCYQIETAFYIHTFRAAEQPGALYRAYPGPWQVLRYRKDGAMECVYESDTRPELRNVALEYFSNGLRTQEVVYVQEPTALSDDTEEYYRVLNLEKNCSGRDVVLAYRELAKAIHPDKGGDPLEFYAITKAYSVLKDPVKRGLYDKHGEKWVEHQNPSKKK